jgi:hypothetical protein
MQLRRYRFGSRRLASVVLNAPQRRGGRAESPVTVALTKCMSFERASLLAQKYSLFYWVGNLAATIEVAG